MFGQRVTDCRRRLAQTCAAPTAGRCLTTRRDHRAAGMVPTSLYATTTIDVWLNTWQPYPDLRRSIRCAWHMIAQALDDQPAREQVKRVQGPVSAVVAQLLRLDWKPIDASRWAYNSTRGTIGEWQLPDTGNKLLDTHQPIRTQIYSTNSATEALAACSGPLLRQRHQDWSG